jgi:hypothetical protein
MFNRKHVANVHRAPAALPRHFSATVLNAAHLAGMHQEGPHDTRTGPRALPSMPAAVMRDIIHAESEHAALVVLGECQEHRFMIYLISRPFLVGQGISKLGLK